SFAGMPPATATPRKPRPHALSFRPQIASVCPAVNARERRDRPMWNTTQERIDAVEREERTGPPGTDAQPGTEGHVRRRLRGADAVGQPPVVGQTRNLAHAGERVRRPLRTGTAAGHGACRRPRSADEAAQ